MRRLTAFVLVRTPGANVMICDNRTELARYRSPARAWVDSTVSRAASENRRRRLFGALALFAAGLVGCDGSGTIPLPPIDPPIAGRPGLDDGSVVGSADSSTDPTDPTDPDPTGPGSTDGDDRAPDVTATDVPVVPLSLDETGEALRTDTTPEAEAEFWACRILAEGIFVGYTFLESGRGTYFVVMPTDLSAMEFVYTVTAPDTLLLDYPDRGLQEDISGIAFSGPDEWDGFSSINGDLSCERLPLSLL